VFVWTGCGFTRKFDFLGENLFEEKVLPKPLSKTFLGGCCRFVLVYMMGRGKRKKLRGVRFKSVRPVDVMLV